MMSSHAQHRCQARGLRQAFIGAILVNADVDRPIGDNCRIIRVSRQRARHLNIDDRLGRYAVIWSDDTCVLPVNRWAASSTRLASTRNVRFRRNSPTSTPDWPQQIA